LTIIFRTNVKRKKYDKYKNLWCKTEIEHYLAGQEIPTFDRSSKVITMLVIVMDPARGGVRSTRGLGPIMTVRVQSIGISIGMLPQTLIMSRLDQLSRLGERIYFFSLIINAWSAGPPQEWDLGRLPHLPPSNAASGSCYESVVSILFLEYVLFLDTLKKICSL